MDDLKIFMRTHVLNIDINQRYYSDYLLKNYINLNSALRVCGHETTELANAIRDCKEAINNMHDTAVRARQHFDRVSLQMAVREELDNYEKHKSI